MTRILLTGHQGYIGSHLLKRLNSTLGNISVCDLKSGEDFGDIRGQEYDVVIHLAASVSVMASLEQPESYLENNCYKVLRFLRNNRVGRFIFTSTGGAMYGNTRNASEDNAKWSNCLSPYAQSKYLAEQVIREMIPNHVILRLGNVYGGDYSVRGEASVHAHFSSDNPILVYGGAQTRDFVHIDTVCQALIRALDCQPGTFNISSGSEQSILSIAHEFSDQRGVNVVIEPARAGEVEYVSLDISRAKSVGLLR